MKQRTHSELKRKEDNHSNFAKTFNFCRTIDVNLDMKNSNKSVSKLKTILSKNEFVQATFGSSSSRIANSEKDYSKKSTQTIPYYLSRFFNTSPLSSKYKNSCFSSLELNNKRINFSSAFKSVNPEYNKKSNILFKKENNQINKKNKKCLSPISKSSTKKIKKHCANSIGKIKASKEGKKRDKQQDILFDKSIIIKRRKIVNLFYSNKIDYGKYVNVSDKRMNDLKKKYQELEILNNNLNLCFQKKRSY